MPFLFKVNQGGGTPITETWGENSTDDYNARMTETHIRNDSPDSNNDGYTSLYFGQIPMGPGPHAFRDLIKFSPKQDISGATVTSAKLYLWCASQGNYEITSMSVYRVLQNWTADEATWNSFSTGNSWNTAGCTAASDSGVDDDLNYDRHLTPLDSVDVSTTNVWYSLDITSLVQGWVDGTIKEYGVVTIGTEAASTYATFYSSENADDAHRPYLEITYTL